MEIYFQFASQRNNQCRNNKIKYRKWISAQHLTNFMGEEYFAQYKLHQQEQKQFCVWEKKLKIFSTNLFGNKKILFKNSSQKIKNNLEGKTTNIIFVYVSNNF